VTIRRNTGHTGKVLRNATVCVLPVSLPVTPSSRARRTLGRRSALRPRADFADETPYRKCVLLSFTARNRQGKMIPAYARLHRIPGNNFLSNTWRVNSESSTSAALTRTGYGVLSEIASNAWTEFWPDVKHKVFRK